MGTDQKKNIDVTKLIGQPTNDVCHSIELWSAKYKLKFDMTNQPSERHLSLLVDAYMAPSLSDECLKISNGLNYSWSFHGLFQGPTK